MFEVNIMVQNADGTPLMPTHHYGRAKRMLRSGKARIVSRRPFVIRLTYQIENPGLDIVTLGIDPGRTNIGLALIDGKGRSLGSYVLQTDNKAVPKHMKDRRIHRQASRRGERKRRQRRAVSADRTGTLRKTRIYRMLPGCKRPVRCKSIRNSKARFNNRKRPEGWLTPTARNLLDTHLQAVKRLAEYYPIRNIAIEINRFDFAKMENPGILNWQYQKGKLFGFADRNEAVFSLQHGRCLLCGRRKIEHDHHIVPRSRGGSESIDNIAGLCMKCHELVHKSGAAAAKLQAKKQGELKKYHALSVLNQIMQCLLTELSALYPTYVTTGQKTHRSRIEYGLPEKEKDDNTHHIDAWIIAVDAMGICPEEIPTFPNMQMILQFRRHDRAGIHYQKERTYYLDGRIVCKNRHKRTGQTDGASKYISLAEYRAQHPHEVSRLSVRKSTRGYNDMKRELPGALVRYKGHTLTVSGKHNDRYQFVEKGICREAPIRQCRVICHNRGLVFA